MGIAYLGIGTGGAIVPFLAVWLTRAAGWHVALQMLGLLIAVVALPFALTVPEPPERADGVVDAAAPSDVLLRDVLRAPAFYLLAIGSMCSIAAVGGANQHLKLFLSFDLGYSQGAAARVASLVLLASLVGRVAMGWLADRIEKKHVMLLIYLLVAGSIPVLLVATGPVRIYLFAVVFGLGLGGEYMVIPLMAAELFGTRVLGRTMGLILTADGIAEATAPVVVGHLRDTSGHYTSGFWTLIAFAVAGAIAVAFLPRAPVATRARSLDVG